MTEFDKLPFPDPNIKTLFYAGIGARKTPVVIRSQMTWVAEILAKNGYTLRSGGAEGADTAFEWGAGEKCQIFFPYDATPRTIAIAKEIHPKPNDLGESGLKLMARNTLQVFGGDLDSPVNFVLCWTPDGCEHWDTRTRETGGTGQAIEMASRKGIPVINMFNGDWKLRLQELLNIEFPDGKDKHL